MVTSGSSHVLGCHLGVPSLRTGGCFLKLPAADIGLLHCCIPRAGCINIYCGPESSSSISRTALSSVASAITISVVAPNFLSVLGSSAGRCRRENGCAPGRGCEELGASAECIRGSLLNETYAYALLGELSTVSADVESNAVFCPAAWLVLLTLPSVGAQGLYAGRVLMTVMINTGKLAREGRSASSVPGDSLGSLPEKWVHGLQSIASWPSELNCLFSHLERRDVVLYDCFGTPPPWSPAGQNGDVRLGAPHPTAAAPGDQSGRNSKDQASEDLSYLSEEKNLVEASSNSEVPDNEESNEPSLELDWIRHVDLLHDWELRDPEQEPPLFEAEWVSPDVDADEDEYTKPNDMWVVPPDMTSSESVLRALLDVVDENALMEVNAWRNTITWLLRVLREQHNFEWVAPKLWTLECIWHVHRVVALSELGTSGHRELLREIRQNLRCGRTDAEAYRLFSSFQELPYPLTGLCCQNYDYRYSVFDITRYLEHEDMLRFLRLGVEHKYLLREKGLPMTPQESPEKIVDAALNSPEKIEESHESINGIAQFGASQATSGVSQEPPEKPEETPENALEKNEESHESINGIAQFGASQATSDVSQEPPEKSEDAPYNAPEKKEESLDSIDGTAQLDAAQSTFGLEENANRIILLLETVNEPCEREMDGESSVKQTLINTAVDAYELARQFGDLQTGVDWMRTQLADLVLQANAGKDHMQNIKTTQCEVCEEVVKNRRRAILDGYVQDTMKWDAEILEIERHLQDMCRFLDSGLDLTKRLLQARDRITKAKCSEKAARNVFEGKLRRVMLERGECEDELKSISASIAVISRNCRAAEAALEGQTAALEGALETLDNILDGPHPGGMDWQEDIPVFLDQHAAESNAQSIRMGMHLANANSAVEADDSSTSTIKFRPSIAQALTGFTGAQPVVGQDLTHADSVRATCGKRKAEEHNNKANPVDSVRSNDVIAGPPRKRRAVVAAVVAGVSLGVAALGAFLSPQ
ncbi:hypothetical protein BC832DRAFT_536849 [Gaertneriomyces semiglobifer]|nr:hypothetical protein BC832DRAFT_536849 [Gaertneriomyces semiglobifer]